MNHDHDDDFDLDDLFQPANDNAAPDPRKRRVPRHVARGRTNLLLALAGYDPEKIPHRLHSSALRVLWCFDQGLFNPVAVRLASDIPAKKLARTLAALAAAKR